MKKICFVVTSMGGGGAERNVSILANHFAKVGNEVHIFMLFNSTVSYELDSRIHIYYSNPSKTRLLSKILFWKKSLNQYCYSNCIDVVVGIGIKYGIICAFSLMHNKHIRLIVRGTSTYKLSFFERLSVFLFGNRIDRFVTQTIAQSRLLPLKLRKKCVTISNPFITYDLNNNKGGFSSKRFICVGRLDEKCKKQSLIIEAFSLFSKNYNFKNYTLHFYGSDNDNGATLSMLKNRALELNVANVYFHPFCSDIKNEIVNSTAFVCCSTNEGMPNALIEALMLGIPAITSDWDGSEEIITDKKNGYIFGHWNETNNLSKCMKKMAELTKDDYESLSNGAFEYNRDKFDYNKAISEWNKIL